MLPGLFAACAGDEDPVLTSAAGQGWIFNLGNGNQSNVQIVAITFDKNDAAATGSMPAQKVNANTTVELLTCAYTSPGKTFAGWAPSPLGAVTYADKAPITPGTNSFTLYARWSVVVRFDANGGMPPVPAQQTNLFGNAYGTLPIPAWPGYAFAGWWPDAGGTGSAAITNQTIVTRTNHTLYAKWGPLTYMVSFDSHGGTPNPPSRQLESGAVYGELPDVTKSGTIFMGWWTGVDESAQKIMATNIQKVAADHVLHARWGFIVTCETFGGTAVSPQTVRDGGKCTQPAGPTKADAVFGGWYKDASCLLPWDFSSDTVTADTTLYARWNTGHEFVSVPAGTYTQTSHLGQSFEHTLSAFKMAKYEVTYALWKSVHAWATNNGYAFANPGREGHDGTIGASPTDARYEPVTYINWRDAIVWCNAYSQKSGLSPVYCSDSGCTMPIKDSRDGAYVSTINTTAGSVDTPYVNWNAKGYRLPTEGEWQYVASYKDGSSWTPYDWASGATGPYTDPTATSMVAWYATTGTQAVGTKAANGLGIYDMSGNVWEWCWDWEGGWPVVSTTDYAGPASGGNRILRGGSYGESIADHSRIGFRYQRYPYLEFYSYGFRLARNW